MSAAMSAVRGPTQQWINTANTTLFGDLNPGQGFRQRGSGIFGGGQMGYNWQASQLRVRSRGHASPVSTTAERCSTRSSVPDLTIGSAGAPTGWRPSPAGLGYAVSNNLFYVKGGYAGVNNRLSVVDAVPLTGSGSQTQWHNGWTVGAGWEYGITQNWIVGLEY